jgi:hypothetical protein
MREICTSGSMSGEGKRSVGHTAPSNRASPRLYSVRSALFAISAKSPVYPQHRTYCGIAANRRFGPSLCEKSHRQKKRRIVFFVAFSRRQLLALFVFKSDEIETEVLNPN